MNFFEGDGQPYAWSASCSAPEIAHVEKDVGAGCCAADEAEAPRVTYLPCVMSKLIGLGFSMPEVIAMSTSAPDRVIGRIPKHGTLQVGAPPDLSILEVVEGPVSFVYTRNNTREGKVYLKPAGTVVAGVAFGRPYQAPFTVR